MTCAQNSTSASHCFCQARNANAAAASSSVGRWVSVCCWCGAQQDSSIPTFTGGLYYHGPFAKRETP